MLLIVRLYVHRVQPIPISINIVVGLDVLIVASVFILLITIVILLVYLAVQYATHAMRVVLIALPVEQTTICPQDPAFHA